MKTFLWIGVMVLLAVGAMAEWSNTVPSGVGDVVPGPYVVSWQRHLASTGTNAHAGLIATNQIGNGLGWVNGLLTATGTGAVVSAFGTITGSPDDNAALSAALSAKVGTNDATYTSTVAKAASALQDASAFDPAGSAAGLSNALGSAAFADTSAFDPAGAATNATAGLSNVVWQTFLQITTTGTNGNYYLVAP